jgi:hypothetical protein
VPHEHVFKPSVQQIAPVHDAFGPPNSTVHSQPSMVSLHPKVRQLQPTSRWGKPGERQHKELAGAFVLHARSLSGGRVEQLHSASLKGVHRVTVFPPGAVHVAAQLDATHARSALALSPVDGCSFVESPPATLDVVTMVWRSAHAALCAELAQLSSEVRRLPQSPSRQHAFSTSSH